MEEAISWIVLQETPASRAQQCHLFPIRDPQTPNDSRTVESGRSIHHRLS